MSAQTTHRRASIVRAVTLVIAMTVTVAGVWLLIDLRHKSPDCPQVRAMIDYNKSQRQALAKAFDLERATQPSLDDYQNWANHMQAYATSITDPKLAPHAHRLADDTQQFVSLNAQIRNDMGMPADPETPAPWVQTYANLNQQFNAELAALNKACPGP
jgi:hypothetical protein